jgi:DNA-binding transcriptional regulator YhcF (GntR family)
MSSDTGYRDNVASHRIADDLRTAILNGSYLPGERIRQEDIAARSGASRIPVREALRMLDAEGLVTLVANSGAWVTRLTLDECVETYLIRERLEPFLLRRSMPGLSDAAIERLGMLRPGVPPVQLRGGGVRRDVADHPPHVEHHPALPARVHQARGAARPGRQARRRRPERHPPGAPPAARLPPQAGRR